MESTVRDQRICLRFCASNGVPLADAYRMLERAYGDLSLSESTSRELYEEFEDDDCSHIERSTAEQIKDQRICLKFCFSNKISCAYALKMLQKTYGDAATSRARAYDWYKAFKDGRKVVEDLPRSGRPPTSNTEENIKNVKEIVLSNPRVGVREIAKKLGISFGSARHILVDMLSMRRVADTWLSKT